MDRPEKKCAHCSIPCDTKCFKCSKVGYCGAEHQKLHWKTHKSYCFPAIELKNDIYGTHLVSTRKILAGEMIFAEGPLILGPTVSATEQFPVCLGCSKALPGIFGDGQHGCVKCSWPLCKPDCDKISRHSDNECKIFQAQNVKPTDFREPAVATTLGAIHVCIRMIRILLLKESDPKKFETILQLESRVEVRNRSEDCVHQVDFALAFIQNTCKMSPTIYAADLIQKLLGVILVNTVACYDDPEKTCESYIYEKGSKLYHSCIPNTKIAMKKNTTIRQVFAVIEIAKGEMLTDCYGFLDTFWKGFVERQQNLNEIYRSLCSCRRCSDPTELGTYFSAIKCMSKNCSGFYLPRNPLNADVDSIWICTSETCKNTQKYSKLSKTVAAIQNEVQESKTVEEKLRIIEKHSNVSVHENHFTLMKLRFDLFTIFVGQFKGDLEYDHACTKTIEFAKKCLEIANKLAPGLSLLRSGLIIYLAMGLQDKIISLEMSRLSGLDTMSQWKALQKEAKQILEVCPEGTPGDTLYKNVQSIFRSFFVRTFKRALVNSDKNLNESVQMLKNDFRKIVIGFGLPYPEPKCR